MSAQRPHSHETISGFRFYDEGPYPPGSYLIFGLCRLPRARLSKAPKARSHIHSEPKSRACLVDSFPSRNDHYRPKIVFSLSIALLGGSLFNAR